MFEIHNFLDIYKAFNGVPKEQLKNIVKNLQVGVNGSTNSSEQTLRLTKARKFRL